MDEKLDVQQGCALSKTKAESGILQQWKDKWTTMNHKQLQWKAQLTGVHDYMGSAWRDTWERTRILIFFKKKIDSGRFGKGEVQLVQYIWVRPEW